MRLHESGSAAGSKSTPKRISRGTGSGLGRNTGRGEKGQNTRSGGGVRPGFEGGRMPLYRRLPGRGFTNPFAKHFVATNVNRSDIFDNGTEAIPESLLERRVVSKLMDGVKISGNGNMEKNLAIIDCKLSKQVTEKIAAAERKVEVK